MIDISFEESRQARIRFVNSVVQCLQSEYPESSIDWKSNEDGRKFSSERLWDECYKPELEHVRLQFMKNPVGRIDRHKIIALTQSVILRTQPLEFGSDVDKNASVELNARFAFLFGVQFISRWNEIYYPEKHFENPSNPFDTEKFLYPLLATDEGGRFICEHRKSLMAKRNGPFPLFLVAQLWFALEQWGLTYAKSQKSWPREKRIEYGPSS